jgi:DNA polymerase-4
MDMDNLRLVFGRQAYVIHQRALGIDPTPVYPPRMKPTVAEEVTLPRDENDDGKLLGILYGLVERCSHRLRSRALLPRKAGLVFRYADQEEVIRRINLPHGSFWDFDLYEPLEKVFLKACRRRVRVRFMKVWFREFSPPNPQLSLFPTIPPVPEKKIQVTRALDSIRERYGDEAIKYGRTA